MHQFHYIYTGELIDLKFSLVLGIHPSQMLHWVQVLTLPKGYICYFFMRASYF